MAEALAQQRAAEKEAAAQRERAAAAEKAMETLREEDRARMAAMQQEGERKAAMVANMVAALQGEESVRAEAEREAAAAAGRAKEAETEATVLRHALEVRDELRIIALLSPPIFHPPSYIWPVIAHSPPAPVPPAGRGCGEAVGGGGERGGEAGGAAPAEESDAVQAGQPHAADAVRQVAGGDAAVARGAEPAGRGDSDAVRNGGVCDADDEAEPGGGGGGGARAAGGPFGVRERRREREGVPGAAAKRAGGDEAGRGRGEHDGYANGYAAGVAPDRVAGQGAAEIRRGETHIDREGRQPPRSSEGRRM